MSQQTSRKNFYDLDKIKQVPILEVCNHFGIELERKGGSIWCKLRAERTASAIIHPETNTYHDFGVNQTGDTIGLLSTYFSISRGDAIRQIADAFYIAPENPRTGLASDELTIWEYKKIGLDGQMATKNFDFDLSRQSVERVSEISLRYAMPMNNLKKNSPRIYERLLLQRAIPHVRDLRNDYFMQVFSIYNLSKAVGAPDVFYRSVEGGEFADMIKELQSAERILERACKGTQIKARPVGEYDPKTDIDKLLSGELKLALGSASYQEMKGLSARENSPIMYRTVDFNGFMNSTPELYKFSVSAFIKDGKVVVGFLEKDHDKLKPILGKIRIQSKSNLNQQIADAEKKLDQLASDSYRTKSNVKANVKGEER